MKTDRIEQAALAAAAIAGMPAKGADALPQDLWTGAADADVPLQEVAQEQASVVDAALPTAGEPLAVLAQASTGLGASGRGAAVEVAPVITESNGRRGAAVPPGDNGQGQKDEDDEDAPWWLLGLGLLGLAAGAGGGDGGGGVETPEPVLVEFNKLTFGTAATSGDFDSELLTADKTGRILLSGQDNGDPLVSVSLKGGDSADLTVSISYGDGKAEISYILNGGILRTYTSAFDVYSEGDFKSFLIAFASLSSEDGIEFNSDTTTLFLGDFGIQFTSLDNNAVNGNIVNALVISYGGEGEWSYSTPGTPAEPSSSGEFVIGLNVFESGSNVAEMLSNFLNDGGIDALEFDGYAVLVGDKDAATLSELDVDGDLSNGTQIYIVNAEGQFASLDVTVSSGFNFTGVDDLFLNGEYKLIQA